MHTRRDFLQQQKKINRKREFELSLLNILIATFDEHRRTKWEGMLNPMRCTNEGTCTGGERDATCDHGLFYPEDR